MSRPQIFLRDLLEALDRLEVDSPAAGNAVLRMLSLESALELARAVAKPAKEERPATPRLPPERRDPARTQPVRPAEPARERETDGSGVRTVLEKLTATNAPAARPVWFDPAQALSTEADSYASPLDSLVDPRQARSILAGAAAGVSRDGDLDVARIVEALTRLEPLRDLPRRREWSLRRGLEVLVDSGPAMAPFARDTAQLVERLRDYVPPDRLRVLRFVGTPLIECWDPSAPPPAEDSEDCVPHWIPPPAGAPVLLVSTFGRGPLDSGRASTQEWLEFAAEAASVHLRTLVPWSTSRLPASLVRALRIIPWDRRTNAGTVRRALDGGGR